MRCKNKACKDNIEYDCGYFNKKDCPDHQPMHRTFKCMNACPKCGWADMYVNKGENTLGKGCPEFELKCDCGYTLMIPRDDVLYAVYDQEKQFRGLPDFIGVQVGVDGTFMRKDRFDFRPLQERVNKKLKA